MGSFENAGDQNLYKREEPVVIPRKISGINISIGSQACHLFSSRSAVNSFPLSAMRGGTSKVGEHLKEFQNPGRETALSTDGRLAGSSKLSCSAVCSNRNITRTQIVTREDNRSHEMKHFAFQ